MSGMSGSLPLFLCLVCIVTPIIYFPGGVFTKTEMSEVLTEIVKMDPTFDKEEFVRLCQFDFIPNILEVLVDLFNCE